MCTDSSKKSLVDTDRDASSRILFSGIWAYLSPHRRVQLGLLFVVMLCSGVAELISLGAVVPFLAVIIDPTSLWDQPFVQGSLVQFGFNEPFDLLIPCLHAL